MEHHETALDAIYEDPLSDSEIEEGEIELDGAVVDYHPMDVDRADGAEEGGSVEEGPCLATLKDSECGGEVFEFNSGSTSHVNGETGGGKSDSRSSRRRKTKKRSGKRPKSVNVARFVRETCNHLQEKKMPLIWAAVKKLGVDVVRDLVKEVDVIENCGGQYTNDAKRRRTPGGVLWNILKGRVQPDVYKEIMSQGNEVQKQKAKESLKRNRMDVDELPNKKRQKVAEEDASMPMAGPDTKKISQPHQRWKIPKHFPCLTDGPVRDDSLLPVNQLQKAWIEGIRKKEGMDDASGLLRSSEEVGLDVVEGGADLKVPSGQKTVPVLERLRVPVEYSDLIEERKIPANMKLPLEKTMVPVVEGLMVPVEYSDLIEETKIPADMKLPQEKTMVPAVEGLQVPVQYRDLVAEQHCEETLGENTGEVGV